MSLDILNKANTEEAARLLSQCCTSDAWIARMLSDRPYDSAGHLQNAANKHWQGLAESDYLQAFDGHPKIGNVRSLKAKYANTEALAAGEQSSVNTASDDIIDSLAEGNKTYEEKFGFIFIVCATGKSASEMLSLLQARLPNTRDTELINAIEEQRLIFQLRLEKLL